MVQRHLAEAIRRDVDRKIVLLSGPRQCGKTTLARSLFAGHDYLNFDHPEHRMAIQRRTWDRKLPLLVLDELHKKSDWKRWLKGIYDVEGNRPRLLVTGSARLDVSRRAGDSLAGRYFHYRLFPLDHAEMAGQMPLEEVDRRLRECGGFPEPFMQGSAGEYQRWQRAHLDVILRQDLIEMEQVRDVVSIQTLVQLLRERVGTPVSYASLARDLERDAKTVKQWIAILENLYVVFSVAPFHRSLARAIRKEPKIYFYDVGQLRDRPAAQLENIVALSLKKELSRREDALGESCGLFYLRTIDGQELDFLVQRGGEPSLMIEVKSGDAAPARGFGHFAPRLPGTKGLQLVDALDREHSYPSGLEVRRLARWLSELPTHLG